MCGWSKYMEDLSSRHVNNKTDTERETALRVHDDAVPTANDTPTIYQ